MSTYNQEAESAIIHQGEPDVESAAVCESGSTPTLRRNCTEHKSGYPHGATLWTKAATATPVWLTHMNVMTNVNGTVFVCQTSQF